MSSVAELHLLKQRVSELEDTVGILDRAKERQEEKLRDKFAMAALSGLISNQRFTPDQAGELAPSAYAIADAMLLARGEK